MCRSRGVQRWPLLLWPCYLPAHRAAAEDSRSAAGEDDCVGSFASPSVRERTATRIAMLMLRDGSFARHDIISSKL